MQDDESIKQAAENTGTTVSKSDEIQRFEILRSELVELERRVKKSADPNEYEEVFSMFYYYFTCLQ